MTDSNLTPVPNPSPTSAPPPANPPGTEFTPYELLVRWNDQGQLQGAHCQWLGKLKAPDGTVIAAQPMPIEPIALAEDRGFPIGTVFDRVTIDALKRVDELQQQIENLKFSLENANGLIANYQYQVDQLQANIQEQQGTSDADISDRTSDPTQSPTV